MTVSIASTTERLSCAQTAALVRKALKERFPSIPFSVRSKTYSGGASIDIGWTDGPTSKQVEEVTHRFEGASFDGMIDLKSYHDSTLNGRRVHFGADFIFTQRAISPAFAATIAATVTAQYGITADDDIHAIAHTLPYPISRCWTFAEVVQQVTHTTPARMGKEV